MLIGQQISLLCRQIAEEFLADFVGVAIYNERGKELNWRYVVGNRNNKHKLITVRYGKGIAGTVVRTGSPMTIANFPEQTIGKPTEYPIMLAENLITALAVPIMNGQIPWGVLLVGYREKTPFTTQQILTLQSKARQVGECLHTDSNKLAHSFQEVSTDFGTFINAFDDSAIIALTDRQGIIQYVNNKFCEVSGYSRAELIGKSHRVINSGYHPQEFFNELWRTISSGKVWRGEIKNKAKDGTFYWVDTTIIPFLDQYNRPYQYLSIRNEITEHKQNEEEVQHLLQQLMDLKYAIDVSTIVAITDGRGIITYVNDKFCEISQYTKEELIGKTHRLINSNYHPQAFFTELWQTIRSGKVWKGEIKNRAKDGSYYWVDSTIVPFLDEKGNPYQYLAIRHDISDRKRTEEELQTMMSKIIQVQEEERKKVSRELHDGLGQNLYSLLISINRLGTEVDHPLIDNIKEEVTELIEETRMIAWELRPSILDDLGLIPAIRSFLKRYSDYYHIYVQFESQLKERLPLEMETTIYRIIQEALTNARKYASTEMVTVSLAREANHIKVSIEDYGQGFEKSEQGIGLFSMEERARAVGGTLQIFSTINKGTTVLLQIPIVPST